MNPTPIGEQRDDYAMLVPVWNGTMQRSGEAMGLTAYSGHSSLHGCLSCDGLNLNEVGPRPRKKRAKPDPARDMAIRTMLVAGHKEKEIAAKYDVSIDVVKRIARQLREFKIALRAAR